MVILIKILHSSSDNKSAFLLYNGGMLTTDHECMRDGVFREGKSAIILIVGSSEFIYSNSNQTNKSKKKFIIQEYFLNPYLTVAYLGS
jgi:hypothetical protein